MMIIHCSWTGVDPLAEKYYGITPYVYCAGDPVNRVDPEGRWDVKVSASSDRKTNPYAIFSVFDRNQNLIYKTVVRVKGIGGRDRTKKFADTPTGKYRILEWRKTGNDRYKVVSYGINDLLALEYYEGEAMVTHRQGMHVHGGRDQSALSNTQGCIRIADDDILELKMLTESLEKSDPLEEKGILQVANDLDTPVKFIERQFIKDNWERYLGELPAAIVTAKRN